MGAASSTAASLQSSELDDVCPSFAIHLFTMHHAVALCEDDRPSPPCLPACCGAGGAAALAAARAVLVGADVLRLSAVRLHRRPGTGGAVRPRNDVVRRRAG